MDNITYVVLGERYSTRCVDHFGEERRILMKLKQVQFIGPFRVRYPTVFAYAFKTSPGLSSCLDYFSAEHELASWCQQRTAEAMSDPRLAESSCLLRNLLDINESGGSKQPLDRRYIAAELLDDINVAEATVSVTATYLVWRLTQNPKWQHKICGELVALPIQLDGSLSFSDINTQISSLEACLREVYKLHPANSGRSERVVPKAGDKALFPSPDTFLPQRWIDVDEVVFKRRDAQIIPFGYGSRICLGKALATMEIKILIAKLYLKYVTVMAASSTEASMKQCSTHDAVPAGLACVASFKIVAGDSPADLMYG